MLLVTRLGYMWTGFCVVWSVPSLGLIHYKKKVLIFLILYLFKFVCVCVCVTHMHAYIHHAQYLLIFSHVGAQHGFGKVEDCLTWFYLTAYSHCGEWNQLDWSHCLSKWHNNWKVMPFVPHLINKICAAYHPQYKDNKPPKPEHNRKRLEKQLIKMVLQVFSLLNLSHLCSERLEEFMWKAKFS